MKKILLSLCVVINFSAVCMQQAAPTGGAVVAGTAPVWVSALYQKQHHACVLDYQDKEVDTLDNFKRGLSIGLIPGLNFWGIGALWANGVNLRITDFKNVYYHGKPSEIKTRLTTEPYRAQRSFENGLLSGASL